MVNKPLLIQQNIEGEEGYGQFRHLMINVNYSPKQIIFCLFRRNFLLPRSAWPIYFTTINEW